MKIATVAGDTLGDSVIGDLVLSTMTATINPALLVGFPISGNTTLHSVLRVDSNIGVTVTGAGVFTSSVSATKGFYGSGFSNLNNITYVQNLVNAGTWTYTSNVAIPNGLYGSGFCNLNNVTYIKNLLYQLPLSNTVVRTVNLKLGDKVNVYDFGATGDGVTDDTTSIQNAITTVSNLGGGVVEFPKGIFLISTTLIVSSNVSLNGSGSDATNIDTQIANSNGVTILKWGGVTSTTACVLQQTGNLCGGVRWSNFAIDGAIKSGVGISLDRVRNSIFSNIVILRTTTCGMSIKPNTTTAGDNCMWNMFENIRIRSSGTAILIDSFNHSVAANVCNNTFDNLALDHQNYALEMYSCINNSFRMVSSYSRGGTTGYDILMSGVLCRANYFFHSQGQISAVSGANNAVWGYDRDNGQAAPFVDSTSRLFAQESGSNAQITRDSVSHQGLSAVVGSNGDWTPAYKSGQVDYNANILLSQRGVGAQLSASMSTATSNMVQLYCTTDGTAPGLCQSFGKSALGFFGTTPITKPVVAGSKATAAAYASLLAAMVALGLVTDSTTT